ncbi:hypothetical protein BDF19DRAFT_452212 [Syncephalis fuscata]|nr:hypothetical protein BDF19DRAFT_452212 [Syncephalis fuscata]
MELETPTKSKSKKVGQATLLPVSGSNTPETAEPLDSILPTPRILRLTNDELRERLRAAYRQLGESNANLQLAAELGQELLISNTTMKEEYEKTLKQAYEKQKALEQQLVQSNTSNSSESSNNDENTQSNTLNNINTKDNKKYDEDGEDDEEAMNLQRDVHRRAIERVEELSQLVFDLESAQSDLSTQLESAHALRREQEERNAREVIRLREELEKAQKSLALVQIQSTELANDKCRLAQERTNLLREAQNARGSDEALQTERERNQQLEQQLDQIRKSRNALEEQLAGEREERTRLTEQLGEAQNLLRENEQRHQQHMQWKRRFHEKERELEAAEVQLQALNDQLSLITPASTEGMATGVTLFAQVDDRRKRLEENHEQLAENHRGLKRAHDAMLQQQGRMRSHISRLTQMAQTADQEERLRRLEQALGQSQSENQQLQAKVARLERQPRLCPPKLHSADFAFSADTSINSGSVAVDSELVHWLQLRVNQLSEEIDVARHELRTTRLLQAAESEKVRSITTQLNETASQLRRVTAENTRLQLVIEEINLYGQQWMRYNSSFVIPEDKAAFEAYNSLVSVLNRLQQPLLPKNISITKESTTDVPIPVHSSPILKPLSPLTAIPSSSNNSNNKSLPPPPKQIRVQRDQVRTARQQECNQQ